jgi:two-component system OmpR family response regulator
VGDLILDRSAHEVSRAGRSIELAPKEFAVLEFLMEHPGQVLSRSVILERVWDYSFDAYSNVVDVAIRRIRQMVEGGAEPPLIHTVRGVGYKIKAP